MSVPAARHCYHRHHHRGCNLIVEVTFKLACAAAVPELLLTAYNTVIRDLYLLKFAFFIPRFRPFLVTEAPSDLQTRGGHIQDGRRQKAWKLP